MALKYGKYRATVVDNNDPQGLGRIRVKCPKALGSAISSWAMSCFPPGFFSIPEVGELVFVEFEEGDIDMPVWTGIFQTASYISRFGTSYLNKIILANNDSSYILIDKTTGDITIESKRYIQENP
jgi:hypothetical protein